MDVNLCSLKTASVGTLIMNEPLLLSGSGGGVGGGIDTVGAREPQFWYCHGFQFHPLRSAIPAFVIGEFTSTSQEALRVYSLAGQQDAAREYMDAAKIAMSLVKDWFGNPRLESKIVELGDTRAIPFESAGTLITPLSGGDSNLKQLIMVHQLTHASLDSARNWIHEGLATFAQALQRENQDGRRAALQFLGAGLTVIADAEKRSGVGKSYGPALIDDVDDPASRSKAAYVWWMLRDLVGDEALKKTFAAYHAEQDNDPSYVPRLVQAQSKRDLNWFFDDWVYHDRGLPDFRVASVFPTKVEQGYLVTITVENLGAAGAEVPVTLKFDGGQVTQRLEVRGKASASIRFNVSGAPQEVDVNDGSVPEMDMSNNVYTVEPPTVKQ